MADVFERRAELNETRQRLWALIEATPHLDWLLLTKRPQNIGKMVPWAGTWPRNVWLGTTVETQTYAAMRIPHLLEHKTVVHFLSCEPLLGELNLGPWLGKDKINWVIAGGESGPGARPMSARAVRALRDQCKAGGCAFHFKQWGHWVPAALVKEHLSSLKATEVDGISMLALGKKEAGRDLDGRSWDELPLTKSGKVKRDYGRTVRTTPI